MSTIGSPGALPLSKPVPPQRGSFPLDHEGECKQAMTTYLGCLKKVKGVNEDECRGLAKTYLACRMERNLMAKDDFKNLGFKDEGDSSGFEESEDRIPLVVHLLGRHAWSRNSVSTSHPASYQVRRSMLRPPPECNWLERLIGSITLEKGTALDARRRNGSGIITAAGPNIHRRKLMRQQQPCIVLQGLVKIERRRHGRWRGWWKSFSDELSGRGLRL
ncbi:hypothetical protein P8C59_004215 [Phyllachora maydis]|uniref:Cytochrome c oxidase assembly protein COX19 n=1 Tax=Phyllachora maydis TaxID=1825666 RepID=A0AAD9I2B7_9PEZI|nr:hypothetical protein P8C59_004215 [Phyllachora maydis]